LKPREALDAGIAALGLELDATARQRLLSHLALLDKWNRTHNLTAIRDVGRAVTHHLLDSLAVLAYLPRRQGLRLLDVGSGGGLPGIPLAIARPGWRVTLLDSNRKKCAFLRQAALELGLTNVDVVASRAEAFAPVQGFDVVIARALAELERFAAASCHLLVPGGWLVAMKGAYPAAEVAHLPASIRLVRTERLTVPGIEGERHLVIMQPASG
jgi:16S rRNA (guanine527-N7)-methyltransferase